MSERALILVVGVGRSGTSLLAGVLGQLGFHIPTPEVKADDTNPRGFGEPRWAVDFNTRLLRERRVTVNDARPAAWPLTAAAAGDAGVRAELTAWLREQFAQSGRVVVKDPRTVWFLPLWERCAAELGVPTVFVTMLRHPSEVIASARKSYGTWLTDASRAAAWLNVQLETEHLTRHAARAFIRYEDLLADWRTELARVAPLLELPTLAAVDPDGAARVDSFVDPTLHRNRVRWDEFDVPAPVQEMAEDVWTQVQGLARPGGDDAAARTALDASRVAYARLYSEAEAIAQSSVVAARPRKKGAAAKPKPRSAPPTLRMRLTRRVPPQVRERVNGLLGR